MAESFITHDLVQHITSDKQHWGVTYHQLRAVKSEQLLCLHSAPERPFRRRALMQVVGSGLKSQACVLTFIASLLPSLDTVNHGPLCLPISIYLFYRGKVWETQKPFCRNHPELWHLESFIADLLTPRPKLFPAWSICLLLPSPDPRSNAIYGS